MFSEILSTFSVDNFFIRNIRTLFHKIMKCTKSNREQAPKKRFRFEERCCQSGRYLAAVRTSEHSMITVRMMALHFLFPKNKQKAFYPRL